MTHNIDKNVDDEKHGNKEDLPEICHPVKDNLMNENSDKTSGCKCTKSSCTNNKIEKNSDENLTNDYK